MRVFILASFSVLALSSLAGCSASSENLSARRPQAVKPQPVAKAPPAPAAVAPTETEVAEEAPVAEPEPIEVPRACEAPKGASENALGTVTKDASKVAPQPCFPSARFVEGLCSSSYPGVALVMFHPQSPWKRGYLKGETKAWTATPAAQQEERLKFKEEILVLQSNNGEGGALAGQGDSFFALRWNGSCVKLTEEEITTPEPWGRVAAPIQWGWLDDNIQSELLADPKVLAAQTAWKKECRTSSATSARCVTVTQQLTDAIVARVRSGVALPEPTSRPKAPAGR